MSQRRDRLTDEEARALWTRALEMQLEAARRVEERNTELLLSGSGGGGGDGFGIDEVTAAAREAGISPEYVEMALAEQDVTVKQQRWSRKAGGARARRLLRPETSAIELSRTVKAPPAAVLAAMQRVLPSNPYSLVLEDSRGDGPLQGGTLVFRVPGMQTYAAGATFAWEMAWGTVTHLLISLRPETPDGGGDPSATEILLRAPLLEHHRKSYWLGLGLTSTSGLIGGVVGVLAGLAAGAALPVGLAAAAVAGPALMGAGGLGAMGVWGSRAMHRAGIRKSTESLRTLLQVVDVNARTGGSFPTPNPGPAKSTDYDFTSFLSS